MPENVNTSALVVEGEPDEKEDDRPVMIKVDHVSMSFNMASEQLNSLKEYAVAIAKRKLFFEEFKALDDVSFEVRKGDVFGIMGTNGSGKSTMLKIIAGVLEPTKGTCQVNGNIAPLIELGAGFDMDLSARENIYLNGALLGYSKEFIDENFDAIVEFAEVEKFLDMPLKNYSSGMVARIAFAIATVIVPEILVVDEVLSVGDFMFQKKCEDRITELIEQHGVTVLIVSHSNDQIARLCNKAIWIEKGHERLQGDADMVCRVYGGLGGRTGSKEAEDRVFEALNSLGREDIDVASSSVFGESSDATNVALIEKAWPDESLDGVVVACGLSHVNALVATPFAGALRLPVISTASERLSDVSRLFLSEKKPKKIYFFDCGNHAEKAREELEKLNWHPSVLVFNESSSLLDFCLDVYQRGLRQSLWGDDVAFSLFSDGVVASAFSPFLFSKKIPVIVGSAVEDIDKAVSLLKDDRSRKFYFLGSALTKGEGFSGSLPDVVPIGDSRNTAEACLSIIRSGQMREMGEDRLLIVGSAAPSQWPEHLSVGSVGGAVGAKFLLVDSSDLDSISGSLDYIREHRPRKLLFLGGTMGLSYTEKAILLNESFCA